MLEEAAACVLRQTYRPIELVIVDDGSTDDTSRVCAELARCHPEVRVVRQENAGPGAARERGRRMATGEFIQYLDSDDLLDPRKFELQVRALREHPQAGVAYCISTRVGPDGLKPQVWARTSSRIDRLFPDFLMKRGWDTNSPLWRRTADDEIGPWLELRCMEDWEHDVRAGLIGVSPIHVPVELVTVRDHSANRASGMSSGLTGEMVRDMFVAHRSIWLEMRVRGLVSGEHMPAFARKMFWISRLCGDHGLIEEANQAMGMAWEMFGGRRVPLRMHAFSIIVRLFGWPTATAMAAWVRAIFRRCEDE